MAAPGRQGSGPVEPTRDDDEGYDSDETAPEDPGFDMELPWFRRIAGREDRTPYTRTKCVVHVKVPDTIGLLRAQVREVTGLAYFDLTVNGEKLEEEPPADASAEEGGEGGSSAADTVDELARALKMAAGPEKERLEWMLAERERLAEIPTYDDRTLESIGVKEPPPPPEPKPEPEPQASAVGRRGVGGGQSGW